MDTAALLTLLITLLQDAPDLISVIQIDVADLSSGTLTTAQLQARWTAMQSAWTAAKTKWATA